MSPSKVIFFLAVAICFQHRSEAIISLSGVLDVINVAKEVVVTLLKTWDFVDQNIDYNEVPLPILHRTENKLFSRIDRINTRLGHLASRVEEIGTQSMTTILHNLPERVRLELRLNDLLDYRTRIDTSYRRMQKYTSNQKDYERLTLEDFAITVISHDSNSIINLLERIHSFIVPNEKGIANTGLFELLEKNLLVSGDDFLAFVFGVLNLISVVFWLQISLELWKNIYIAHYIRFRIMNSNKVTYSVQSILRSKLIQRMKVRIYILIRLVVNYGYETWTLMMAGQ